MDNPADSVFCAHGAGCGDPVAGRCQHAQVDSGWRPQGTEPEPKEAAAPAAARQYLRRDRSPG